MAPSDGGVKTTMVTGAGPAARAGAEPAQAAMKAVSTAVTVNFAMVPSPTRGGNRIATAFAYNWFGMVLDNLRSFKTRAIGRGELFRPTGSNRAN